MKYMALFTAVLLLSVSTLQSISPVWAAESIDSMNIYALLKMRQGAGTVREYFVGAKPDPTPWNAAFKVKIPDVASQGGQNLCTLYAAINDINAQRKARNMPTLDPKAIWNEFGGILGAGDGTVNVALLAGVLERYMVQAQSFNALRDPRAPCQGEQGAGCVQTPWRQMSFAEFRNLTRAHILGALRSGRSVVAYPWAGAGYYHAVVIVGLTGGKVYVVDSAGEMARRVIDEMWFFESLLGPDPNDGGWLVGFLQG